MKPTQEQQNLLKTYLWDNLRYNETYAEVYDHILTALESQPDNISFQDTIDSIINDDFGGFNGLAMIETRYRWAATREIQNRYLMHVTECVKPPLIGILIISLAAVYYMICQPWFTFLLYIGIWFLIAIIPSILNGIRYAMTGYIAGSVKRSVKDFGFSWLRRIPGILFGVFVVFYYFFFKNTPVNWFNIRSPVIITLMFIAYMVHALAFYRVYRHDFKVSFPKK